MRLVIKIKMYTKMWYDYQWDNFERVYPAEDLEYNVVSVCNLIKFLRYLPNYIFSEMQKQAATLMNFVNN